MSWARLITQCMCQTCLGVFLQLEFVAQGIEITCKELGWTYLYCPGLFKLTSSQACSALQVSENLTYKEIGTVSMIVVVDIVSVLYFLNKSFMFITILYLHFLITFLLFL